MDISKIDKNFITGTGINKSDIKFYDVKEQPFKIYGLLYENGKFRRIPEAVAKSVSDGVYMLHSNTAGGRIRFRTNSPYVAIYAKMPSVGKMPHFALCGSAGFDLYVGNDYAFSFLPPFDIEDGYSDVKDFDTEGMKDITINLPLYSDVSELYIGLSEEAVVLEPYPYENEKPIIFYGSSITQGGCASRPGSSYQGFISRWLNTDYINLGFSGNARAEKEISNYIKGLCASVFVYDYDHNAPTVEYLDTTHERMFLEYREANPTVPVVIMSRPKYTLTDVEKRRLEIIRRTYNNAIERGDRNVYLIEGPSLMELAGNEGTVDNCHPTDLGFFSMAKALVSVLEKIL